LNKYIEENFNVNVPLPVCVSRVKKFESDNSHLDFKINIIYQDNAEDKCSFYPLYMSKDMGKRHHINLAMFATNLDGVYVRHYVYIEDVNKFFAKRYVKESSNNQTSHSQQNTFVCQNCLSKFTQQHVLVEHLADCLKNECQRVTMPSIPETFFRNQNNKFRVPIEGFYDFEAIHVEPTHKCDPCGSRIRQVKMSCKKDLCDECKTECVEIANTCTHATLITAYQKPITYSLIFIDKFKKVLYFNTYTGMDCARRFIKELLDIESKLLDMIKVCVPMRNTAADKEQYRVAELCHICCGVFTAEKKKVRDHCHLTG